ncbi:hypothetical protein EJ07DRAFT_157161 [Lizonia empirigonia]|nr:hypothetical protein EJ07DRAFT_157161 [Lizonia empirigonia]
MDTNQLAQELNSLRRNFAQYRVEMALRIDSLERRLSAAESALPGPGRSSAPLSIPPLRRAPAAAPAPVHGYGSPMPGFAEHRRHPRAPVPINTAPASSGTQVISSTPYAYPWQPPRSATPARRAGSSENATFLPFVLERIASASQRKSPGDNRTCACGRPTFDVKCFRERHFDWCLLHQRPIVQQLHSCGGRDHRDCQPIHWEKHADWELLVKASFDVGDLGRKKVKDLYEVLFPEELYPEKYQGGWYVG